MANGIPCPNPTCTHVFAPTAVAGAAALTCPRCGMVFQLRARPARPTGVPAPLAVPAAQPVIPEAESLSSFVPPSDLSPLALRRSAVGRRRSWGPWVVLLLFLAVLLGGLGFAFVHLRSTLFPSGASEASGAVNLYPQLNCRFLLPDKPWQPDNRVKQSLKALLALRRSNPDAWFVLVARDGKDRTPREGEVRDEGIRRLQDYFVDSLEWEPRGEVQLAGLPAQQIVFRGQNNDEDMSGECTMLTHQGIAYWLMMWAPSAGTPLSPEEFEDLRKRFSLVKERESRSEKRPAQTFRGRQAGYSLRDKESVWKEWTPATDYDPKADLALVARERQEPMEGQEKGERSSMVAATVLVLVLNEANAKLPAAVETARAHLEKQQKIDYPETVIEPLSDKALTPEQPTAIGQARGHLAKLLVKNGESRQRFVLLGVVPQPEYLLVIQCECDWKRRSQWENDFSQLLSTLEVKAEGGK